MPDNQKPVGEQIREAAVKIREEFAMRKARREAKIMAAFTEYFSKKWQEEIDLVQSDAIAASVAEVQGGVRIFLECEANEEPNYYIKYSAAASALEKLRKQGFGVELDASDECPDIYKIWKE